MFAPCRARKTAAMGNGLYYEYKHEYKAIWASQLRSRPVVRVTAFFSAVRISHETCVRNM